MNRFTKLTAFSAAVALAMGASVAHAEEAGAPPPAAAEPAPPAAADAPDAEPAVETQTQGSLSYSQAAAAVAPAGGTGATDHERFVGKFAIGYLGFRQMGFASGAGAATTVEAPVIGVRYWLDSFMGLDVGLGLSMGGGEDDNGMTKTDVSAPFVFILHGGLPLTLADSEHFVFQVIPELNFGLASQTIEGMPDVDVSGTHFDLGARAGAEIHFGFIDIPQLSLQAGVGLRLSMDSVTVSAGDNDISSSRYSLGTSVGDNPWNIFTGNIAALYYFDM